MNLQPTDYKCAQNDFLMLHCICFQLDTSSFFSFLRYGLFSCVSCCCRTFVALASNTINRTQEPERAAHTMGRARHTPAGNEGITKCSPPCPAGNMGLTPTPCGHSREYPRPNKKAKFSKANKKAVHKPGTITAVDCLSLCVVLFFDTFKGAF